MNYGLLDLIGARRDARADVADRILSVGLMVTALAVTAQTTAQLIDFGVYGLRLHRLDSGLDWSIPGWAGVVALALAAAAAGRVAAASRRRNATVLACVLAAVLAATLLHAHDHPLTAPVLYALLAAVLVLLWREAQDAHGRTRRFLHAAAALLVLSFLLHVVGPRFLTVVGIRSGSWLFEIKVAFKQGSEIAGWLLVASGLAAASVGAARSGQRANRAKAFVDVTSTRRRRH